MQSFKDINSEIPVLEHRYQRVMQLFTENKIPEITDYLNQVITNINARRMVLERCVDLADDIEFRANFEVYLQRFLQSMDIVLPNSAAEPYKIPAKHLGDMLYAIKNRYKDDSLNIANVGKKIKLLIDEHLISTGVNPQIAPTELFSENFIQELNKNNASPKAVASEMEHAIRKHIKVNMEKDPALYSKLYEKLEEIIKKNRENWEKLADELQIFRDNEVATGRKDNQYGLNELEAVFFDFTCKQAKITVIPDELVDSFACVIRKILQQLRQALVIIDFWNKPFEINNAKSGIIDILIFSGIDIIADQSDHLASEIVSLAKVRNNEVMNYASSK